MDFVHNKNEVLHSIPLFLQLPRRVAVAATIRAALVVATLGDVLLTRCSGSRLRVNLLPPHLFGELAAELRGHGATKSALAVGSVQHLGRCHDWLMRLRVLPLAAFSISAVATFRVPRPSGDGYNAGGYIALWLTPQSRLAG